MATIDIYHTVGLLYANIQMVLTC